MQLRHSCAGAIAARRHPPRFVTHVQHAQLLYYALSAYFAHSVSPYVYVPRAKHRTMLCAKRLAVPRAKHLDSLLPRPRPITAPSVSPHTERFAITFIRPFRHLARAILSIATGALVGIFLVTPPTPKPKPSSRGGNKKTGKIAFILGRIHGKFTARPSQATPPCPPRRPPPPPPRRCAPPGPPRARPRRRAPAAAPGAATLRAPRRGGA